MDILVLLDTLRNGDFPRTMSNPLAMFGRPKKPFLGSELMPERLVNENQFTEEKINYRTVIANDGTRYSPVQIKGSVKVGSFDVKLRSSDTGSEFKASEYDALISILKRYSENDMPMQAMLALIKWADTTLNMPLIVKNEKMIWEVIVDALVSREGDNGYSESVPISNPPGHRVAAVGSWSDDTYNPLDDIYTQSQLLADKGLIVKRQIAGTPVVTKLLKNAKVQAAVGGFINVSSSGALIGNGKRVTLEALNAYLAEDNMAPIVKYDNTYQDQAGSNFFLKRDVFVQIAETDQSETINLGDAEPLTIDSTLGYVGIGTTAGETSPGRHLFTEAFMNKPPRIEGQSWQESFPVNQNPEAVSVINSIT